MSAHEPGETTDSQLNSGAGTNNGALGNKLESIKGAVDALAAAVAAAAAVVRSSGKNCLHAAAKPVNIFNFSFKKESYNWVRKYVIQTRRIIMTKLKVAP